MFVLVSHSGTLDKASVLGVLVLTIFLWVGIELDVEITLLNWCAKKGIMTKHAREGKSNNQTEETGCLKQ
jgi:hypothetical protein